MININLKSNTLRYDPETAYRNQYKNPHGEGSKEHAHQLISNYYPSKLKKFETIIWRKSILSISEVATSGW